MNPGGVACSPESRQPCGGSVARRTPRGSPAPALWPCSRRARCCTGAGGVLPAGGHPRCRPKREEAWATDLARAGRQEGGGGGETREPERRGVARALPSTLKGGLATLPGHMGEALAGGGRRAGRFLFLIFTGMAHPGFNSVPSCLCAFPAESNYTFSFLFFFFLIGQ